MNFGKLRIIILSIFIVLILGGLGVYFGREPLKNWINGIRADRLQAKAVEAFDNGLWDQASRQGQAAHYLDPENKDIQLLVAQSTLKERLASTVGWWKLIVDEPELPVEELRQLVQILLATENLEDGLLFLNRLVELDPDSPETLRLWLIALEKQRHYGRAAALARSAAMEEMPDWDLHQFYMSLENNLSGDKGDAIVIEHLRTLMNGGGALALNAARELLMLPGTDPELRLEAAEFLETNALDDLDRLYASSIEVREGRIDRDALLPILKNLLEEPEDGTLYQLLRWARFMDATDWFLENVSWDAYQENKGDVESYLAMLLEKGLHKRLLDLTEKEYSEGQVEDAEVFLYFRAMAQDKLGLHEEAESALNLALQVTDPTRSLKLERFLIRNNRWDLLVKLYDAMLVETPDDLPLLFKSLAANYYLGLQDGLRKKLEMFDERSFDDRPAQASFIYYLKLVVEGYNPEMHSHIESLLSDFSQVSDFRPIVGLSYLLKGDKDLAASFLEGIPDLSLDAPRFIRVAAVLLGAPESELLLPGEVEFLLPRERFLLSQRQAESTP